MWEILNDTLLMMRTSFSIIFQNWFFFIYLLILSGAFSIVTVWFLSDILIDRDSLAILSFLGGTLGFSLFSLGIALLKIKPSFSLGMVVIFAVLLLLVWRGRQLYTLASPTLIKFVLFFLFILLTRLIFIQGLIVPPYADSVQHLLIVQDFLNPERPPQAFYRLSLEVNRYYHFGFHALAAWLSGSTYTSPEQAILLLGQYFQTLAILGVYPLARIFTKNSFSAWTVMCIAGLLLPIPAYASNWGKYPAIASLTGISFVLSLMAICAQNRSSASKKFWWLICFAIFSTIFLHSRTIFIFTVAIVLLILFIKINLFIRQSNIGEDNISNIAIMMILTLLLFVQSIFFVSEYSFPLFLLTSILVMLAFYSNFVMTSLLITLLLAMGLSLLIPIPSFFHTNQLDTIMDRPFLLIFLYLPSSLIIWYGLEGGIRLVVEHKTGFWRRNLLAGVLIIGIINVIFIQDYKPSDCCIFIKDDDLFAFEWMKQNIPKDAIVGIAATGEPNYLLPTDGGAWIEQITGIPTRKLDSTVNFAFTAQELCYENVTYFYIDDLENSFDEFDLVEAGGVYQFSLGSVRMYRLECDFIQ